MQFSELADEAAASFVSTQELLRKLKVIASRTAIPLLAEWVEHELTGYDARSEVPSYRGPMAVPVYGTFSGPYGSGASNVPIPPLAFQEEVREGSLFNFTFREGIPGLEYISTSSTEDNISVSWPADAIAGVGHFVEKGVTLGNGFQELVGAKQALSRNVVVGVLAAVRNRVLDLALELERLYPDVAHEGLDQEKKTQSVQVVNAVIYGNAAIGSSEFSQLTSQIVPTTPQELFDELARFGVEPEARRELESALAEDEVDGKPRLGQKVAAWLGKHADTATEAGAKQAGSALATGAGAFVGQLVRSFFFGAGN